MAKKHKRKVDVQSTPEMFNTGLPVAIGWDPKAKQVIVNIEEESGGDWAMEPDTARKLATWLNNAAIAAETGELPQ